MTVVKQSLIKDSKTIHASILKRIEQLKLKQSDIIKDAAKYDITIQSSSLSKYLDHGNVKGGLGEETIIWLCIRYGIDIFLMVGTGKIVDGKLKIELSEYNETKALAKLKVIFG